MVIITTNNDSPYGTECIRCSDSLIAPDESQYISERHVSHSWLCESCGQQFETSHRLDFNVPSEPLVCQAKKSA
jgi:hypothetical protein